MNKKAFLPWPQLMTFGLGRLQLTPRDFWAMTLREMDAAIEGYLGSTKVLSPPSRTIVNHMMVEYPDNQMGNNE